MKKKVFWRVLVIAWCTIIFFHSSMPASVSSEESGFITALANQLLGIIFGENRVIVEDMLIRKTAHFVEYMILACLSFNAIKNIKKLGQTFVLAVAFSVAYAITDEIHQFFIPGRAMRIFDIGIDSLGILTGTSILYLHARYKNRLKV